MTLKYQKTRILQAMIRNSQTKKIRAAMIRRRMELMIKQRMKTQPQI